MSWRYEYQPGKLHGRPSRKVDGPSATGGDLVRDGLIITYMGLLATAATGALVFFGFALFLPFTGLRVDREGRPRPGVPLNWVIVHIVFAAITLALFSLTVFAPRVLTF
jgi:hypothetical protein